MTARRRGEGLAGGIAVLALALLAGCSPADPVDPSAATATRSPVGPPVLDDAVTGPLVAALPVTERPPIALPRLADGLVPPTSTWFSGLALAPEPQPVFPLPLSFALTEGGVEFGVPEVSASPGAVQAPHAPSVVLDAGADDAVVTRYDEVSLTVALAAGGEPVAEVLIARGSPVVGYRALAAHAVRLVTPVERADELGPDVHLAAGRAADAAASALALVAPGADVDPGGSTLELGAGAVISWVVLPEGSSIEQQRRLVEHAAPVEAVQVTASLGRTTVSTALDYATVDGGSTVIGRLPHQADADGSAEPCDLGEVPTISGPMQLCPGPQLAWSVPALAPAGALDLAAAGLSSAEAEELVDALEGDVAATGATPPDTYFGGKALARLATLLQLARELARGDGAVAERAASIRDGLHDRLADELGVWAEPQGCAERAERCVVYDPVLRGVVGQAPSFGSEEFNDHHFHYGYFLYSAAVLAGATGRPDDTIDEGAVAALRPVLDLLAADLASSGGENFPTSRAFDPYSGHSWASGLAPFADGNNQESSSEAVSAANGLALWAQATGDAALGDQGRWMLAAEAHSARAYYTGFDRTVEPWASYARGTVGIVWDAKRDFSTWFSPEPAAVLGIQLLPMHPVAGYLAGDPQRIVDNLAEVVPEGPASAPLFADALLMYQSLAGGEQARQALEAARVLPSGAIDGGGSRSALLAFIMARR